MNALIVATEALRIANQNSGRTIFEWQMISDAARPVRASNGMWVPADYGLADFRRCDVLVVLEGNLPTQNVSPAIRGALRNAFRHGSMIVGVDTGAFAIAAAGLMGNREAVVHWEAVPAYMEHFPGARTCSQIFSIEGQLAFCAGGVATLDLVLALIGRLAGQALAREVANALVHTPREDIHPQRLDDGHDERDHQSLSQRTVSLMESNLDFPLSSSEIAAILSISVRTLERCCVREFNQSPGQLYLRLRLQAARNLLFYEESPIQAVAVACGFSYPSVFSRAFTAQFGQSPRAFRKALRQRQRAIRPEIVRMSDGQI
ncbi:helix-turn-helix domain-containing protein [Mesorhizobium sp. RP14(2022)]|uniref:Helix-turn-helix domain-containing protein n=1 Tax=Mesorhizobium liriopis TaxID=2953882 RepID=A0ABT1CDL3_9HYPH|nr:helix-turn-helix domain-containing protein [Mesorhizobium liriopis]MCO6052250.1 helix-turn-helix domain-containing protein [Mesorhizobium liriopis]